jgi:hypothetical protein
LPECDAEYDVETSEPPKNLRRWDGGEEVMSFIEKEGANPGYWECDHCGQRALLEWDFMSEWTRLKAEGWRAIKVEGHWMHRCDECSAQAREREKGILDRPFRSVG